MPGATPTRNWFLPGLALSAALALLLPGLGARGGPLRPEFTVGVGVALVFLLHGISIAPATLRAGAANWRLHVAAQLFIFVAFPVAVLALDAAFGSNATEELRIGFIFLAILPTTIASSVIYTAAAGGNTTAALFNAALSNIAGVVVTPLWAAALLQARGGLPSPAGVIGNVALLLLLPFVAGQLVRPLLLRRWQPDPRRIANVSNLIVLYMVFTAFAESAATGAFARTPPLATLAVVAATIVLFMAAATGAAALGAGMRFDRADRIALRYCATQKTLAAGAPMAHILFAGHAAIGVILLPLIIYHAVQLVGGAAMMRRQEVPRDEGRHLSGAGPR
jgi:solute carrier family 10 (sodium/bile acid cotransporter), member 7